MHRQEHTQVQKLRGADRHPLRSAEGTCGHAPAHPPSQAHTSHPAAQTCTPKHTVPDTHVFTVITDAHTHIWKHMTQRPTFTRQSHTHTGSSSDL